ncbi:hypothetical protein CY34DRAFT_94148, partial [Suillus luteus UH-Slu-Lm8-n1]
NSRWLTMLDILYAEKLCIHDWPAGVPPPGPDFDLKALSASQLRALVAPYLRIHLGAMYKAELGLDDDDDSEAEAAKAKKRKGKSKKSGDKGRKKGLIAEEPSVVFHISRWPESTYWILQIIHKLISQPQVIFLLLRCRPQTRVSSPSSSTLTAGSFAPSKTRRSSSRTSHKMTLLDATPMR